MKLLLINPDISNRVLPVTEVLTAPFGVSYIETRFDALTGAHAVAKQKAAHHGAYVSGVTQVSISELVRNAWSFIVLMYCVLALCIFFPAIDTSLPRALAY